MKGLAWLGIAVTSLAGSMLYAPNSASRSRSQKQVVSSYAKEIAPIFQKYCSPCHYRDGAPDGVDFRKIKSDGEVSKFANMWDQVRRNVDARTMPPPGRPQLSDAERTKILDWIDHLNPSSGGDVDAGRVTLRRLNRLEYDNTIRELTGIDFHAADDFPSDDVGYGFDNIGDVLSISPLLMEKYLAAAEQIAEKCIALPTNKNIRLEGQTLQADAGSSRALEDGSVMLFTVGEVYGIIDISTPGNYVLRAKAWGQQAGPELCKMTLKVDNAAQATVQVAAEKRNPQVYEVPITLSKGSHRIAAAFINDYYDPKVPNPAVRDRNMVVDFVEVTGPVGASQSVPESQKRIIFELPTADNQEEVARKVLGAFAQKAFRRPATSEEVDRIMAIYGMARRNKEPFERGIQLGVEAILVSPNFLFRVESDPPGSGASRPLNDWELASRLSYFLWSSMPDDELFAKAQQGKLHEPETLKAEVLRMLKDPKASMLSQNFAEQWLQLRKLSIVSPDIKQFPEFSETLRSAMLEETVRFFDYVVREDRSVIDFIDGKYSFVNGPLAKLYEIGGIDGPQFRKVELKNPMRGGILTQASVLTITSNPTRTSPVKRGKWILENILGSPTPPPPPGAGTLVEEGKAIEGITLRQRLEEHRKKPECAACHAKLDPLGFGLENFNPIGRWRTKEGNLPIDSTGVLPDGKRFSGPNELRQIIKSRKNEFVRTLAEKLMTYAVGRGMTTADQPMLSGIAADAAKSGYKFSSLILDIVRSDAFTKRHKEATILP